MKFNRIALFLFIASTIFIAMYYGGIQSHNFSVNSSPLSIFFALLCGFAAIFFPRIERTDVPRRPVGHWRRYAAVNIDFLVIIALLISLYLLPILAIEYFATGEWKWSYKREKAEFRDLISGIGFLGLYFGLYYYFYKHAALNRPTPGQYIMGYRIIPNGGDEPRYGQRVFHGAFNLWLGVFFLYAWSKVKDGNYQWDKATNTKAVRQV